MCSSCNSKGVEAKERGGEGVSKRKRKEEKEEE
jgi:hypothetical protein